MIRYCLETLPEGSVIHRVDCPSYDLGTLLGLGCLADLGEFHNAAQALESIRHSHPHAVRCTECCKAKVLFLPQAPKSAFPKAGILPSS